MSEASPHPKDRVPEGRGFYGPSQPTGGSRPSPIADTGGRYELDEVERNEPLTRAVRASRNADYADAFRKAAKGREEYAENANATDREYLMGESDAFKTAARLLDGEDDIVGLLRSACPSWRWDELGVDLAHNGSNETPS